LHVSSYENLYVSTIEEFDDYIVIDGNKIKKPIIEKPFDAEDHNINIYYPVSF